MNDTVTKRRYEYAVSGYYFKAYSPSQVENPARVRFEGIVMATDEHTAMQMVFGKHMIENNSLDVECKLDVIHYDVWSEKTDEIAYQTFNIKVSSDIMNSTELKSVEVLAPDIETAKAIAVGKTSWDNYLEYWEFSKVNLL